MSAPEATRRPGHEAVVEAETALDDPRLVRAVQEYQNALEAGQRPRRQDYLARYPEIATSLAQCLEALEFVHTVGPNLDPPTTSQAASAKTSAVPVDPTVPLGDFRILREIGRGGMGVVYEAEQLSLGRRIALKVLPFALTLDPRQLQRFKNEARAAAQLHHSHIVPIYSVGCERGVHFYAMQFVEGQSLAAALRELRRLVGKEAAEPAGVEPRSGSSVMRKNQDSQRTDPYTPHSAFSEAAMAPTLADLPTDGATARSTRNAGFFRSSVRLCLQAAEALEHAHQMGVVHRDIKPGNLLVDGHGQLWVTDFGLAQFQSDAALTVTGDVVGTLRYMSPEQAMGKRKLVDHRTDIYSLGATLYEMLTLEPTFRGRDREELLRQIAFEEPRPPRRLNSAIPVDLETIVLKALAKTPEERYVSAQEMADDLRRFLEDRPILARRPTLFERAAKLAKRHRPLVAAGLVTLVLMAVGFAVSTILIAREQANTQAANKQLTEEQTRTREAYEAEVRNFQKASRMLDFFTQVSAEELADHPESQEVRRKLLQAALEYYQEFIDSCPDDPSMREQLGISHLRVASLLNEMGNRPEAMAALEQGTRLLARSGQFSINIGWLRDGGPLVLLENKVVQDDLDLSEEQRREIGRLATDRRSAFQNSHISSLERLRSKFEELATREKGVLERLGPEQHQRLKQIVWQQGGLGAFLEPEVVKVLKLTPKQTETVREIQDRTRRSSRGGHHRLGFQRPEDWKKIEETWRTARDEAFALLTPDQRAEWDELVGKPFQGELRLPFPGSFGPRPGGPPKRP